MLTEDQLKALMADIESDTAERTESVNNTDKFGQAIAPLPTTCPITAGPATCWSV